MCHNQVKNVGLKCDIAYKLKDREVWKEIRW